MHNKYLSKIDEPLSKLAIVITKNLKKQAGAAATGIYDKKLQYRKNKWNFILENIFTKNVCHKSQKES